MGITSLLQTVLIVATSATLSALADDADNAALLGELRSSPHKILFESYADNNWEIFFINADGSGRRNLTNTPDVHELYPQTSPDGSKLCFLADVQKDGDTIRSIYFMNADGSGRTFVADKVREPWWSPDGTKIAFCKQECSKFNVSDFVSKGLIIYDLKTAAITQQARDNNVFVILTPLNWLWWKNGCATSRSCTSHPLCYRATNTPT